MHVHIHDTAEGSGPTVVLLHGLFGMGSNLGALARSLRDRYSVHSLDLPNHGRSGWLPETDIPQMAQVITTHVRAITDKPVVLFGHSLGGKVAMECALQGDLEVGALVVADIAPVAYPASHQQVFAGLQAVMAAGCSSRQQALEVLAHHVEEPGVLQFLILSFARNHNNEWGWRFNLEALSSGYESLRAAPSAGVVYPGPVLFVKGSESDYIVPAHRKVITAMFPKAKLKVMQHCGHWLHAEQPRLFNGIVGRFMDAALSDVS